MKTITYNPETHVLVPREPNYFELQETADVYGLHFNKFCAAYKEAVLRVAAAAPLPEQIESEQISRMWSEVKELRAELAKYRDAPVVGYSTTNEEGDLSMLFFDEQEARKYSGDDEPIKLIVKPGEEK